MKKITNQNIILKEVFQTGKKIKIKEISRNTNLTYEQVYVALFHLKRRGLIKTERKNRKAGYKTPPMGNLFIEINENVIPRIKDLLEGY